MRRAHCFARLQRVLGRLADQLLDAADGQITAHARPQLERDEYGERDDQIINGDLNQQLACVHDFPPSAVAVMMLVMMLVAVIAIVMMVLADRIIGDRMEHSKMLL